MKKDNVSDRSANNEANKLTTFFILKKLIDVDFLYFGIKKIFNFL